MTIKYSFIAKLNLKKPRNLGLFCDENFNILNQDNLGLSNKIFITNLIKNNKNQKKNILTINISDKQNLILIKLKRKQKSIDNEKIGAKFYDFIKLNSFFDLILIDKNFTDKKLNKVFIEEFLHGIELKSYEFKKYKSKKVVENFKINIFSKDNKFKLTYSKRFNSLISGINFTKELVSEPGNILHPDEYAKRLSSLKKDGLKVTIFDEKKLKRLGMNSLLGVGQGSIRGSYLVCLEWNGAKNNLKPLAFVGKGCLL